MSAAVRSFRGPLSSWSFSTHTNFQSCPKKVYFEKVLKEPKPPLVPPPGKEEHPLTRGTRIHESAEDFVRGNCELIDELEKFQEHYETVQFLYNHPSIQTVMEDEWAFNSNWEVCPWKSKNAWLRLKLDLLLINEELKEGILVDYKTGKKYGNEIKHQIQAQLYQLAAFLRYPELETITVEFWYTDIPDISVTTFKRSFGLSFQKLFTSFGDKICNEVLFNPTPSPYACKWCPYGKNAGTGVCTADYYLAT